MTGIDSKKAIRRGFENHSRTFSLSAKLLPGRIRQPVATLYMFCRQVDTIADERVLEVGPQKAADELETLVTHLEDTLQGNPPDTFFWHQMSESHQKFGLNREAMFELIEGASWDLAGSTVQTEADLLRYAGWVGGSVGAMMLPFLTKEMVKSPTLEITARALGDAMQITNIVRDVGQDLRELNRCYIPADWLAELGIQKAELTSPEVSPAYIVLMERMMAMAERGFINGFEGIHKLPFRIRIGITAAARMYREIMNEVRFNGYNNKTRRAIVPASRKLRLLADNDYWKRRELLWKTIPGAPSANGVTLPTV